MQILFGDLLCGSNDTVYCSHSEWINNERYNISQYIMSSMHNRTADIMCLVNNCSRIKMTLLDESFCKYTSSCLTGGGGGFSEKYVFSLLLLFLCGDHPESVPLTPQTPQHVLCLHHLMMGGLQVLEHAGLRGFSGCLDIWSQSDLL